MGMVVRSNIMAMNANRSLGMNNSQVSKNLEKLSSGYRINRAGDDASGLAISEKMKAQIKGLETASANSQDGISLIQTAEGALTEVHNMLNRMVELAGKAANGTMDNTIDRNALQEEVNSLKAEINRISEGTDFNGIKLLDGSLGSTGTSGVAVNVKYASLTTNPGVLDLQAAEPASSDVTATATSPTLAAGTKFSFDIEFLDASGNYQKRTVTFEAADADITDAANEDPLAAAISDALGSGFTVEVTTGGVTINANDPGSQNKFKVLSIGSNLKNAATGGAVSGNAFGAVANTPGADAYYDLDVTQLGTYTGADTQNVDDFIVEINGEKFAYATAAGATALGKLDPSIHVVTLGAATAPATGDRAAMITLINDKTGIAAETSATTTAISLKAGTAAGSSGNGLTLQIGDTSASFNKVTVSIADMSTRGLGITGLSVATQDDATAALELLRGNLATGGSVRGAINLVSDNRAALGALQNRLEYTINNLDVAAENMSAANSRIRDTDMAKQMMEYTKTNVLTQAAQAMLAQANQQPQSILQLLQ